MALGTIPPPLSHPVIDAAGLMTRPWLMYFQALAGGTDSSLSGYMLKSVYDPTNAGIVADSDKLDGQHGSYYLDLGNATGSMAAVRFSWNVRLLTGSELATAGDFCDCDASSSAITVTMPDPTANTGKMVAVRKSDSSANAVTISGAINGATSQVLTVQYTAILMASNGLEWCIV